MALHFRGKTLLALGYAAILFGAARVFQFLGISKNAATPTWCLYCLGIAVVLFLGIYWLADVRGWRARAAFVKPAGSNTLLTYLLPDIYCYGAAALAIALPWRFGWRGALRSLIFTGCVLGILVLTDEEPDPHATLTYQPGNSAQR